MMRSRLSGALFVSVCLLSFISTAVQAAFVEQTFTIPTVTVNGNYSVPLTLNQFDPSLGTLDQIEMKVDMTVTGIGEDIGAAFTFPGADLEGIALFDITVDSNTFNTTTSYQFPDIYGLCPPEDAPCTVPLNLSNSVSNQSNINSSWFALFIGNGSFSGELFGNLTGTVREDGFINSTLDATATLTYTYSPIPIPAAAWLFGSGLLGLVGIARRKKTP